MKKLKLSLLNFYGTFKKYPKEKERNRNFAIKFYNWWWFNDNAQNWFYRFITHRNLLENKNTVINFYSVFGNRFVLNKDKNCVKIFFTGENVHNTAGHFYLYSSYKDNALKNKNIDLSLGFDFLTDDRYLRFPLWLLSIFPPEVSENEIVNICEKLRFPTLEKRTKFAANVSQGDPSGIRSEMCKNLNQIAEVKNGGIFLHNDDDLWNSFKNDKNAYLKNFNFNICSENSDCNGYVTEKIFEAIKAGCVPIYWGSGNNPEPEILNHDAILFWKKGENNENLLNKIKELYASPDLMYDFLKQPRLKPDAATYVIKTFQELENRIKTLIDND